MSKPNGSEQSSQSSSGVAESCSAPDEEEGVYFKVSVGVATVEKVALIGPYTEEELNEYGEPKDMEDFRRTVWELIDTGLTTMSKSEAEEAGLAWW
jgi:hypothetical protein